MATQIAIDKQHELRCGERSDRHECQHAHDEKQPCEQRHSHECHPFAAHRDDRRDNVDRRAKGAKATDDESESPIIGRMTRRKRARSEWSIGKPAHIGSVSHAVESSPAEKAVVEEETAKSGQPKAKGIQPRKRHVTSANLKRNYVVGESKQEWHSDQEHHRGAVHREEPVKDLCAQDVIVGIGELKADKQGLGARDEQEKSRVQDVQNPQPFVVDSHYPSVKPLEEGTELRCGCARLDRRADRKCVIAHIRILSSLQCFEVSSNLVQLLIAQLHCGHKGTAS